MVSGYFTRTYAVHREVCEPDGYGGQVCEWQKVADVSGRAWPSRMSEEFQRQRLEGVVIWNFAAEAQADIREADEVRFDGRRLRVQSVAVTSTGRRLEAVCEEERSGAA